MLKMFFNSKLSPPQGYLERTEIITEVQDVRDPEDTQKNAELIESYGDELQDATMPFLAVCG